MHDFRATLILAALAGHSVLGDNAAMPEGHVVRVVIKAGDQRGSVKQGTIKVHSDQSLTVPLNGDANVLSGGEARFGGERIPFGLSLKASVKAGENGKVHVRGTYEDTKCDGLAADAKKTVMAVRTFRIHIAETMTPGETVRRVLETKESESILAPRVGKNAKHEVWMELTIERCGESDRDPKREPDPKRK